MLRRMIVPKKREQPKSTGSSDTSVYRRSEEAEAAILPGQPWFFRDYTEQPVQMKTDNNVIQMATGEQRRALTMAIPAYEGSRVTLQQAASVESDIVPKRIKINPTSHSLVYEWKIGGYTLRGHVHYRGFQNVEMGPVPGHAWIEGVKDFDFLLPKHIFDIAPPQTAPPPQTASPPAQTQPPATPFAFGTRSQRLAPTK